MAKEKTYAPNEQTSRRIAKAVKRVEQEKSRWPLALGRMASLGTQVRFGKTGEAIDQGTSGTVNLYRMNTGTVPPPANDTYFEDTGEDIEAFNLFLDVGDDTWVLVGFIAGCWLVFPLGTENEGDLCSLNGVPLTDIPVAGSGGDAPEISELTHVLARYGTDPVCFAWLPIEECEE